MRYGEKKSGKRKIGRKFTFFLDKIWRLSRADFFQVSSSRPMLHPLLSVGFFKDLNLAFCTNPSIGFAVQEIPTIAKSYTKFCTISMAP